MHAGNTNRTGQDTVEVEAITMYVEVEVEVEPRAHGDDRTLNNRGREGESDQSLLSFACAISHTILLLMYGISCWVKTKSSSPLDSDSINWQVKTPQSNPLDC